MATDEPFRGASVQLVALDQDHPGFNDKVYRARRDEIAQLAARYVAGEPIEKTPYHETEQAVWREIWAKLAPLHARFACRVCRDALEAFDFDHDHIPDFAAINARLQPAQGFSLAPVAGLVRPETFLEQLAQRRFLATQYMRHHSVPLYTPEPDVVHEYVGHVPMLAHPELAALNLAFGHAALRASPAEIEAIIRIYWFTIEFGLAEEDGETKVYGAGLLSSFGEIQRFGQAELRPWDLATMAQTPFDPTQYQAQLYVAPSFEGMCHDVHAWLDRVGRA